MTRHPIMIALASAFFFISPGAIAQAPQQPGPWQFTIDGGGAHQSQVDLKDSEGGFTLDRWFASAGLDYGWSRRDSVGISVGGGQSNYEFDKDTLLGGGVPWNKVNDQRVSFTGRFGFAETGSVIIVPSIRLNKESDARSSDARSYGLLAAAFWRLSDTLTIGPGLGVFTRLDDSTRVFPILAIDWKFAEKWSLSTGRGLAASQGPGLTLGYQLTPSWSLGLTGRYEDVEFRLDDEGPAPGGIGRDQSFPLVLSARLDAEPNLGFSIFAGVELGGRLTLLDEFDKEIQESDYDPAALFGATFEIRF
ncbi:MAG: hypothetical protein V2I48_05915 [Xanthomonadales bacterium]|jgi:hypothetical protein|nr:hypothetical protein [Xanthomonadales bacterium]